MSETVQPACFGRQKQLSALAQLLDSAPGERGAMALISGHRGIGKTRFLSAAISLAEARSFTAIPIQCVQRTALEPGRDGAAIVSALARELARSSSHSFSVRQIAELTSESIDAIAGRVRQTSRTKSPAVKAPLVRVVTSAIRRMFELSQSAVKLAVVIDDLHAADAVTLACFRALALCTARLPIAVLAAYRSHHVDAEPATSHAIDSCARLATPIRLEPLAEQESVALLENVAGHRLAPELGRSLHAAAGGIPELLVGLMSDAPQVTLERRLHGSRNPKIPAELKRRLDDWIDTPSAALNAAAVLGRDFTAEAIALVARKELDPVRRSLAAHEKAGAIVRRGAERGSLNFASPVLRDFCYERIDPATRAEMHRLAALTYGRDDRGSVSTDIELLQHLLLSKRPKLIAQAFLMARREGAKAEHAADHAEAVRYYVLAAEACRVARAAAPTHRFNLLRKLTDCAARTGDLETEKAALRETLTLGEELARGEELAEALFRWKRMHAALTVPDQLAIRIAQKALMLLPATAVELRARVSACLAQDLAPFPEHREQSRILVDAALRAFAGAHPGEHPLEVLMARDLGLRSPERIEGRLANAEQIIAAAEAAGDPTAMYRGVAIRAAVHLQTGTPDCGYADAQLLEHLASVAPNPAIKVRARAHRALRAAMEGRLDQANSLWAECEALAHVHAIPELQDLSWITRMTVLRACGDFGSLRQDALATMRARPWSLTIRALYAWFCAESGDVADARYYFERACADLDRRDAAALTLAQMAALAAVATRLSDRARAARLRGLLGPYSGMRCTIAELASFGTIDYYLGTLCLTLSEYDAALRHLERAASLDLAAGARIQGILSKIALTEALAQRKAPEEFSRAAELMNEVREQAVALGLHAVEQRCAQVGLVLQDQRAAPHPERPDNGPKVRLDTEQPARSSTVNPDSRGVNFTLRRDGDYWIASRGNNQKLIKHVSGLLLIEHLIKHPGERFHVLELAQIVQSHRSAGVPEAAGDADLGPMIDKRAEDSYGARLRDLQEELEAAHEHNDLGRVERLEAEMEFIARELSRTVGLHGRPRRSGSRVERARLRITNVIKRAIRYVEEGDGELGYHLRRAIRTGTYCCYLPDTPVSTNPGAASNPILERLSNLNPPRK